MLNKEFTMTVTTNELSIKLKEIIRSPNSNLIIEVILENLAETAVGLEQLYKAFSGIKTIIPFMIDDEVWVPFKELAYWNSDETAMLDQKMIIKGYVKCRIRTVMPRQHNSLNVSYTHITESTKLEEIYSYTVRHASAILASDFKLPAGEINLD